MYARNAPAGGRPAAGTGARLVRLGLLLLPAALLLGASLRQGRAGLSLLWLGALFQGLACALFLLRRGSLRESGGLALIMLYVIGLCWLLLASAGEDWFAHLAQALLLVVPLGLFARQYLRDSGASSLRQARLFARRMVRRRHWPDDLQECRFLPEVKALREALHVDASPALSLLSDPRPAVRVAALAALELRQNWRPGQPEVVLALARRAPEPEVRAAAVSALANVEDRLLIESVADLLADPAPGVRQAATEALLWNTELNWAWVRLAVRKSLADPTCQEDGPLNLGGNPLSAEAVADFTAWAAEKGLLAQRAALTLGAHYHLVLSAGSASALLEALRHDLASGQTPAMLRVELARLLHQHRELGPDLLRQLLATSAPAPVRLIAVEALLSQGACPEAMAALHDLARLPNREIALATAEVLQRRLGVDLGLPRGQAPPALHSRLAAEIARRVLLWSMQEAPALEQEPVGQRPSLSES
jgi:HEAT repeat protein